MFIFESFFGMLIAKYISLNIQHKYKSNIG
jgi:hypothetical protein